MEVDLNLDGNYVDQVQQATTATEGLTTAVSALQAPARGVQQALNSATPSKAHLAAWGGFTAAAAYWQQQTSGIRATASAAGQSMRGLEGDVRRLASSFPIGTSGAVAMVQAIQGLGASQRQIGPLAVTMQRLAGATNSFGPELATNFGQLNRELASLDPARVGRFGDVLTTLSARSGASAMGIVNFAHAIAPMAQQAGLGETAVLGISTAFTKLGDDGGAAATAVNKILSDLNRSVREGSNDMAAYAQITGMTVTNFRQLYQANPAQALTAVTTAIGRAGPRGQMELENLGLEGVRTQRALLQLSQSGGLGTAISQAQQAYGNGSTRQAAQAAFGGLNDSLTELRSTAGQTADALGGPFLHVLTRLTDLAKTGLGPINSVLGSTPAQYGILGLGAAALGARVLAPGVRRLGVGAIGLQAATSGPVRGLVGGFRTGYLGPGAMDEGSFFGRFGMYNATGRGPMLGINRGAIRAGSILGETYGRLTGPPSYAPGEPGLGFMGGVRRVAGAGFTAGAMGYDAWLRSFRDPFHQAFRPAGERSSLLMPGRVYDENNQVMYGARGQGALANFSDMRKFAGMGPAFTRLQTEVGGSGRALGLLAKASAAAARDVTMFGLRAGGAVAGAGLRAGGTLLGGLASSALGLVGGGVGAALLGGGLAYSAYRSNQRTNSAEQDRVSNLDMFSVLNTYRDAIGQAGEATQTLADQMAAAATAISRTVSTIPAATTVSSQDIAAAGPPTTDSSKITHRYTGSNADIAGQVRALNLNGLSPQDLQAVKMDMLHQGIRPDRVNTILGAVAQAPGANGTLAPGTLSGLIGGVAASSRAYSPSILESEKRHPLGASGMSDWRLIGSGGVGSKPLVGDTGKKTLDLFQNAIMQQYADLSGHFSQGYAIQQTIRSANVALQDALKTGDPDVVAAVAQREGIALTGNKKFHVSAQAVRDAGGDITKLLGKNTIYGQSSADLARMGVTTSGAGVAATRVNSGDYTAMQSAGAGAFLPYFAAQRPGGQQGRAYDAISAFIAQPANLTMQTQAVRSFVASTQQAGLSLAQIATMANNAIGTTSGATQQLMQGAYGESQFQLQRQTIGMPRGRALAAQMAFYGGVASTNPNDQTGQQNVQSARENLLSLQQQAVSYYQQRVMAQYQFQIQSSRAQEDYQRQTSRSESDFFRSRNRAVRDFGIQVRRESEDAAKSFYDPYMRIQAKPVWDVANLAQNRSEQISAMRQQLADIRTLRQLGLSDAAISQLGLYDPNNAQQVTQLVGDLTASRSEVGVLNRQASAAQSLAGQLVQQSPDFKRQRADFQRSLRDQRQDFGIAQARSRQDFNIAMARMRQDLHTQDLEITNDLGQLSADMNRIVKGQAVDLHSQLTSSLKDTLAAVNHYSPLIQAGLSGKTEGGTTTGPVGAAGANVAGNAGNTAMGGADTSPSGAGYAGTGSRRWTGTPAAGRAGATHRVVGPSVNQGMLLSGASRPGTDMDTMGNTPMHWGYNVAVAPDNRRLSPNARLAQSMAKAYGWDKGVEWAALYQIWNQESGFSTTAGSPNAAYGIPQADPGWKMGMGKYGHKDWRTSAHSQIDWGLHNIKSGYGDPLGAWAHKNRTGWYAEGGIFTSPRVIGVGEGGPEAVLPLNERGVNLLARAMRSYLGPSEARTLSSGGMATAMHIDNSQHYYDSRTDLRGSQVTVKASSPRELGDALAAKQRSDNLTAPRGVRWSH